MLSPTDKLHDATNKLPKGSKVQLNKKEVSVASSSDLAMARVGDLEYVNGPPPKRRNGQAHNLVVAAVEKSKKRKREVSTFGVVVRVLLSCAN